MDSRSQESLKQWFLDEKRDLPWRKSPSPYAVWISEIMLQQTQVAVVIPYFERWMEQFPSIKALAAAPLEQVIKAWEGLGYYSRARNLHAAAQYLLSEHNAELPASETELKKVKGIGPYTIGAILSFAFHQKAAAVDGNVLRVLARYYGIEDDITQAKTQKAIRARTLELLPDEEPWVISEALIELGAKVCQKSARCAPCPLSPSCHARQYKRTDSLPVRKARVKTSSLFRAVPVIRAQGQILLRKCPEGEIMQDLHEFPYFEVPEQIDCESALDWVQSTLGLSTRSINALDLVKHSFTRYRVQLFPYLIDCSEAKPCVGYQWVKADQISQLAFSSGHRRILHMII